jgi:bacterioferritin-associated ferredoxin
MLVCHCRGISDRQIRRAVKDGATSAREVARETGAGMRCGGCRSNVKAVVNEALAHEFQTTVPVISSVTLLDMTLPVEG